RYRNHRRDAARTAPAVDQRSAPQQRDERADPDVGPATYATHRSLLLGRRGARRPSGPARQDRPNRRTPVLPAHGSGDGHGTAGQGRVAEASLPEGQRAGVVSGLEALRRLAEGRDGDANARDRASPRPHVSPAHVQLGAQRIRARRRRGSRLRPAASHEPVMSALQLDDHIQETSTAVGTKALNLVRELYPIGRSITGAGLRATVERLSRIVPLEITEVASGTPVL